MLDSYLAAACEDAIHREGATWGFQAAVAPITVAVIDRATPEDEAWAARPHGRRLLDRRRGPFSAITFPVLADPAAGQVVRPEHMILGGIYTGYLKGLVRQYVEGPLRG